VELYFHSPPCFQEAIVFVKDGLAVPDSGNNYDCPSSGLPAMRSSVPYRLPTQTLPSVARPSISSIFPISYNLTPVYDTHM
jgi:hypothetical protein